MHELTKLIKDDMAVALGVTEPGAIAFCAAKARSLIGGELIDLETPSQEHQGILAELSIQFAPGHGSMGMGAGS